MPAALSEIDLPERAGGSRGLTTVLGVPDGAGPWPAVVMVHEAYGINDVMRRQVERLTSAGYLVLMPDLFAQGGARRCLVSTFRALRAGEGRAFVDIERAREWLLAREDCTGRVGKTAACRVRCRHWVFRTPEQVFWVQRSPWIRNAVNSCGRA